MQSEEAILLVKLNDQVSALSKKMESNWKRDMGGMEKASNATGRAIAKLGGMMVTYFGARQLGRIGKSIIDITSDLEGYEIRLKSMLRSQDAATQSLSFLREEAGRVPFAMKDVISAGVTVQAFGADLQQWTPLLADLATVMGVRIPEAASAMGRAFAGGAGAADIFRERGVLQLIKDTKGIDDLTKLTLPQFREAMYETFIDTAGPISGAAADMAETWKGKISMLGDEYDKLKITLGTEYMPLFKTMVDNYKGGLTIVNEWIEARQLEKKATEDLAYAELTLLSARLMAQLEREKEKGSVFKGGGFSETKTFLNWFLGWSDEGVEFYLQERIAEVQGVIQNAMRTGIYPKGKATTKDTAKGGAGTVTLSDDEKKYITDKYKFEQAEAAKFDEWMMTYEEEWREYEYEQIRASLALEDELRKQNYELAYDYEDELTQAREAMRQYEYEQIKKTHEWEMDGFVSLEDLKKRYRQQYWENEQQQAMFIQQMQLQALQLGLNAISQLATTGKLDARSTLGGVGSLVGMGAGFAAGGPFGAIIGSTIGSTVGSIVGLAFKTHKSEGQEFREDFAEIFESAGLAQGIIDMESYKMTWEELGTEISEVRGIYTGWAEALGVSQEYMEQGGKIIADTFADLNLELWEQADAMGAVIAQAQGLTQFEGDLLAVQIAMGDAANMTAEELQRMHALGKTALQGSERQEQLKTDFQQQYEIWLRSEYGSAEQMAAQQELIRISRENSALQAQQNAELEELKKLNPEAAAMIEATEDPQEAVAKNTLRMVELLTTIAGQSSHSGYYPEPGASGERFTRVLNSEYILSSEELFSIIRSAGNNGHERRPFARRLAPSTLAGITTYP